MRRVRAWAVTAGSLVALLAGAAGSAGCASSGASSTVIIGVSLPTAGSEGANGILALHGIGAGRRAASTRGLLFEIEARDTARGGFQNPHRDEATDTIWDPPHGAADIRHFAGESRVLGVLGPLTSDVARAEIPVAERAGLALISASARDAKLTSDGGNAFFRLCPSDLAEADAAAQAAGFLGFRRVFVLGDGEPHGEALARAFRTASAKLGAIVAGHDTLTATSGAFGRILKAVNASNADGVLFGGPVPTNVLLLRPNQMKVVLAPKRLAFMAEAGFLQPAFAEEPHARHGQNVDYYTIWPADALDDAPGRAFRRAFEASFKEAPSREAAYYYVAAQALIRAIEELRPGGGGALPARAAVIARLKSTRIGASIVGPVAFAADGELGVSRLSLVRIRYDRYTPTRDFVVTRL